MKVILSRKGFDSSYGGIPSPVMPDGTLLSMPIPSPDDNSSYSDIQWNGVEYSDILRQLRPGNEYNKCHLDPDIYSNRVKKIDEWKPAFGQIGAAQGKLRNAGVESGDLILFFGWFRRVEQTENGFRYVSRRRDDFYAGNDLHIVFGYMQIGEIVSDPDRIKQYYWHPHSIKKRLCDKNNALYLPAEYLSFAPALKGYGTLGFRKDRVLTKVDQSRAVWNEYPFLMPKHIVANVKNSAKRRGLYYAGIWQEMVVLESPGLMEWVNTIIS